jgi:hypothetical protein
VIREQGTNEWGMEGVRGCVEANDPNEHVPHVQRAAYISSFLSFHCGTAGVSPHCCCCCSACKTSASLNAYVCRQNSQVTCEQRGEGGSAINRHAEFAAVVENDSAQ